MRLVKVAAAVLNQTPLDWDGNRDRMISAIRQAKEDGVSVLCLPELCITGYGCEDAFLAPGVQEAALQVLHEILPECAGMVVSVGLPVMVAGALYNTACLVVDGKISGFVAKQNLAGDGIHYEPRWFKAWPVGVVSHVEIENTTYPMGDLLFEVGPIRLGFEICEDAWVGQRPGARQAAQGVDLILNPSASHFAFGKHEIRKRFILEGSRSFFVTYIYANLLGNEAGRAIYDGDAMVASGGKLLASGRRFSYRDWGITSAVADVDATRMMRARTSSFRPEVEQSKQWVEVDFDFPQVPLEIGELEVSTWEKAGEVKAEEFGRAVALGLFDYLRKSSSCGFVVSLSGGADSAAVAVLIYLMVQLASQELGRGRLKQKLSACLSAEFDSMESCVSHLLTTVYQATDNSSETTREAAQQLAEALGARHLEMNVQTIVTEYRQRVEEALGRELTWEKDDIALQNIQARVRAPSVWMLANVQGALLISTSNRSEAAVGYATMDGDTSGGLAPIAGIDKAYLRRWLRWAETQGLEGVGPISALSYVNDQQPTAELRPQDRHQTDEADLMPYEVLDQIERLAIRDKLMPKEILPYLQMAYPQEPMSQLVQWVCRFFRLWSRNQWKRERYAPSFHLDDENLDPKTWCRFPILSSGFRRELEELESAISAGS